VSDEAPDARGHGTLPPGPDEETADGLLVRRVVPGTRWHRIHRSDNGAIWFGGADVDYRFNDPRPGAAHPRAPAPYAGSAPDAGAYAVCYLGVSPEAAFVETFLRRPTRHDIARSELAARRISAVHVGRDLRLVILDGSGLFRAGVSADAVHGADYAYSRTVSRLLWRHPAAFDGIEYAARHDNHQYAVALFDRAGDAITLDRSDPLDAPDQLRAWRRRYRFTLL